MSVAWSGMCGESAGVAWVESWHEWHVAKCGASLPGVAFVDSGLDWHMWRVDWCGKFRKWTDMWRVDMRGLEWHVWIIGWNGMC